MGLDLGYHENGTMKMSLFCLFLQYSSLLPEDTALMAATRQGVSHKMGMLVEVTLSLVLSALRQDAYYISYAAEVFNKCKCATSTVNSLHNVCQHVFRRQD